MTEPRFRIGQQVQRINAEDDTVYRVAGVTSRAMVIVEGPGGVQIFTVLPEQLREADQ